MNEVFTIPNRNDLTGLRLWFEYHCWEDERSSDADLWRRSHQIVDVIGLSPDADFFDGPGCETFDERCDNGCQNVYTIRFSDGFEKDAFEDELLESQDEFCRPSPPATCPAR